MKKLQLNIAIMTKKERVIFLSVIFIIFFYIKEYSVFKDILYIFSLMLVWELWLRGHADMQRAVEVDTQGGIRCVANYAGGRYSYLASRAHRTLLLMPNGIRLEGVFPEVCKKCMRMFGKQERNIVRPLPVSHFFLPWSAISSVSLRAMPLLHRIDLSLADGVVFPLYFGKWSGKKESEIVIEKGWLKKGIMPNTELPIFLQELQKYNPSVKIDSAIFQAVQV